ncbi:MAG: hypothetical protein A3J76_02710 [Candidatus Moranbacteria bacterium RBG_13_45_13]|nr:MAG: hypothetical protein A3J76_02710 [Candidatus Moranbacteria bacterium RBG_13_45_13]
MKRKIKKIVQIGMLLAPFSVMAQFNPPAGTGLQSSSIFDIIRGIMMWLLGILGFVAVIGFVISGIMYLVAAGDEDQQKKAKKAMYYSITGVIVGLVGLIVIFAVQRMLGTQTQF